MNKNKLITLIIITLFCLSFTGCKKKHTHEFIDATCTTPLTCLTCGETFGSALGHEFIDATCTTPKTCLTCGETFGSALGHEFIDATCTTPKTCLTCGETLGSALGHNWLDATIHTPKTCLTCGETEGDVLTVTELDVNLTKNYVNVGSRIRLNVNGYDSLATLEIIVSDDSILSIDEYGLITGKKIGMATITLTDNINAKTKTVDIDVIGKVPKIYPTYDRVSIGREFSVVIENIDELEEDSINDFDISFEKEDILSCNNSTIVANKYGSETITITSKKDSRIKASCQVTIVNNDTFFLISGKPSNQNISCGEQITMKTTMSSLLSNLTWTSSDNNIAVVNEYGIVTIKNEGFVKITAYDKKDAYNKAKKVTYAFYAKGIVEVDYISRLIHTALRENGIKEVGNNKQKYGEWYPNNGQPWCAMFVSWCMFQSGISTDIMCKYQGCYQGMKWSTEQGIMHYVQDYTWQEDLVGGVSRYQKKENYKPVAGDVIFFLSSGMSHTGLAIYSDDTYLYTIEGNTSDQVMIKRWSLNDARITGYAHPNYPEYSKEREDFSWIKELKEDNTYWWSNVSEKQKVD